MAYPAVLRVLLSLRVLLVLFCTVLIAASSFSAWYLTYEETLKTIDKSGPSKRGWEGFLWAGGRWGCVWSAVQINAEIPVCTLGRAVSAAWG